MTRTEWEQMVEEISSLHLQESWDNSGWQVYAPQNGVSSKGDFQKVLLALEINGDVIAEAESIGADLIVTHHPLIFGGLKNVDVEDVTGRYVTRLLRDGISVYSTHTCFDLAEGGNNDALGEILGFVNVQKPETLEGYLRIGELEEAMPLEDFVVRCGERLGMNPAEFHVVGDRTRRIQTAAWCTGSGSEFFRDAADLGVDLYITGDVKYHDAQEALAKGLAVLDAGHYGTEKIFPEVMAGKIRQCSVDVQNKPEVVVSQVAMDPFS